MSDLISREAVINAIADTILNGESLGYVLAEEIVSEIPSADVIDHARAIKEYCGNTQCEDCIIKNCGEHAEFPFRWNLPEGEKEPPVFIDSAPLKDCKNTAESYGEICVKCNKCGRFGKGNE